ncbi:MAG: hypothetical protein AVDCRST_MAG68-1197 [uncultured Gemmatimonadetes bacterium]|uniref:Baseplate protein J-like domain-containing protein n=1 Tax=uncultured Gemmatimonadota bacterium TaxID=203437 RepID=A0A6J4KPC4_9BACT|nr:MAG: hypothetical protein AVDCRST_MAG68-1197 [uncultured Gemmatimonadota bacterium]
MSATILGPSPRSAAEIGSELRREFDRALYAQYGTQSRPDPVLATLFHTLSVQIARVYDEAEHVFPAAVLDDLVGVLGMPPRLAHPAQTVVQFTRVDQRERITPHTELFGTTRTGEQVGWAPDESIEIAPTQLVFAAVFEEGRLHALSGARLPGGPPVPPGSTPLPAWEGPPALYLAFHADEAHLGGLGLYLDPAPGTVADALSRSPWQLLDASGCVHEAGMLRACAGRGGVRRLAWLDGGDEGSPPCIPRLDDGVYGAHVWVFPRVPAARRTCCTLPAGMADAARLLLPDGCAEALDAPLAWVRVPLPPGLHGVADAIQRVEVNCVTASNVEVWSEQVIFDRTGCVVSLAPEGRADRHVMAILGVTGEAGTAYTEEADVSAPLGHGRFRRRAGELEFRPARGATGRADGYAMARLALCDAERANGMEAGDVRRIGASLANTTAQVSNLTVTRGGCAPPPFAPARTRFAELLRTRERVVTEADVEITVRAFEPRVRGVRVESVAELHEGAVRRVEAVTAFLDPADFADPGAEVVRLRGQLQRHLQERAVLGQTMRVAVEYGWGGW